ACTLAFLITFPCIFKIVSDVLFVRKTPCREVFKPLICKTSFTGFGYILNAETLLSVSLIISE
ncbi:MAG: hypothetical protein ABJA79_10235, partial [Parafilimonas sp.]